MPRTFQGRIGNQINRPLGVAFPGQVQQGSGGPGGTDIPGTASAFQNCAGESLGLNEWINWPHLGRFIGNGMWNQAINFVPQGWVRVSCTGISVHQTRCLCIESEEEYTEREAQNDTEFIEEIEVILFLYRWPVGIAQGQTVWQSDFHMIGRSACRLPRGWHSKKDRR